MPALKHTATGRLLARQVPTLLIQPQMPNVQGVAEGATWMLHGILDKAHDFGWEILSLDVCHGEIPAGISPCGAIVRTLPDDPLTRRLLDLGLPVVRVGPLPHPLDDRVPAVIEDLPGDGSLAAGHFHERGFRHVAYIARQPWADMRPLYEAFRQRATDLGMACHLIRIDQECGAGETDAAGRFGRHARKVGGALAELPKPVGLLTYDDVFGGSVCVWARMAGLAVPEEIAVLGRGNDRFRCESSPVTLSSIDTNMEELGRRAAHLLRRLIRGEPPLARPLVVSSSGVMIRRSTDIIAVDNPLVAQALRFIWDHLGTVTVDDLAGTMAVSRRKLERAFRDSLGRSINVELQRKRLELARELLLGTSLSIAQVARKSGIGSPVYLYRAFHKQYGMTPGQFRLKENAEC